MQAHADTLANFIPFDGVALPMGVSSGYDRTYPHPELNCQVLKNPQRSHEPQRTAAAVKATAGSFSCSAQTHR